MDSRPVSPYPAATVALLRDGEDGLEVFLQRRVTGMAFAPDATVFPGGRVDPGDRVDPAEPAAIERWHGPTPDWWAARLGHPVELAAALVVAAIRETIEESGVLLAGPNGGTVLADADELHRIRQALVGRHSALLHVLASAGLVARTDLLAPWARWITPEGEPRRYDTVIFLAEMPAGQRADGATGEVAASGWWPAREALGEWEAGRMQMLPPTWVTIEQLAALPDLSSALAAAGDRALEPIVPTLRQDGDRLVVQLPDGVR